MKAKQAMVETNAQDHAERLTAIDTARSFIVRAPAGSGKTRLLIQRYLALLADADEPEEIVAITFTRKAAAEMRHRVASALAAIEPGAAVGIGLDEQSLSLARAARERDRVRNWNLAAHLGRLRIQTIDSLNASLTRQMPLSARFGAQPEALDDATDCYRDAARATLALINDDHPAADHVATLLSHLDNDVPRAARLIAGMLASRDRWLRTVPGLEQARERLEGALQRARRAALAHAAAVFPAGEKGETLALARFSAQNKLELRASNGVSPVGALPHAAVAPNALTEPVVGSNWPQASEADLPIWLAIADLLLIKGGALRNRRGINKSHGFPPGDNAQQKAVFAPMKARMGELLDRVAHVDELPAALHALRELPEAAYRDADWEALGAIAALLPIATAMLWQVFAERGACDFTEIAQSASRALGEDDAPTDLALALDYRLRHVLIDEFQDTSIAQFELLEKLVRGWNAGDGRSFFAVGDPMQSIYRFRDAEVALFMKAAASGVGGVALEPVQLTVNFRSSPAVIDWVNAAFAPLMAASASGNVPFAPSVAARECVNGTVEGDGEGVTVHAIIARKGDVVDARTREAHRVVAIIESARARQPDGRIAILVRTRTHLREIIPALKASAIAFRAVDIDPLAERPAVRDVLAIARALCHPADRIAWLTVLRAPWCALSANELALLTDSAAPTDGALQPDERGVFELLQDPARLTTLPAASRARALHIAALFATALDVNAMVTNNLRERTEALWRALGGPAAAKALDARAIDDVMAALDLIENEARKQTGGSSIEDFAALSRAVDRLFAAPLPVAADARIPPVEIMTLHKSKGLEWDTVIVPALDRAPMKDPPRLMVFTERLDAITGDAELLVAPVRETGLSEGSGGRIHDFVRAEETRQQRAEDVRLLYVAATRARRHLHWIGTAKVKDDKAGETVAAPNGASLLATLWPVVETRFVAALSASGAADSRAIASRAVDPSSVQTLARLTALVQRDALPASLAVADSPPHTVTKREIDFDWAGETARQVGIVVHRYLQRFANDGLDGWSLERISAESPRIATLLVEGGVDAGDIVSAGQRVVDALQGSLNDARGRWLLGARPSARAEWRLAGVVDGALRHVSIDRSFVEDGVRWIVDYKTGFHEGADRETFLDNERERYRAQLETYARLVRALDASNGTPFPLRLGLYFPLMGAWREWQVAR
jgi:ATP-dependent exoDNAse (exonuclease V) beta subunit